MSRHFRLAALLAIALGLAGCYYGPTYPAYGGYANYGYGYGYAYDPGYYYAPPVAGSFFFGTGFGHGGHGHHGHHH